MSPPFGWPDIIVVAILGIATFKGYRNGFVSELSGAIALAAALIVPWYYSGFADTFLQVTFKLGPGSAHVIGLFLTGLAAYVAVIALAWPAGGIFAIIWLAVVLATGFSSAGSMLASLAMAPALWYLIGTPGGIYGLASAVLIVYTHRANIARLRAGAESVLPLFRRPAPICHPERRFAKQTGVEGPLLSDED